MAEVELFGTPACPYTTLMRDWLEWNGREFVEYDVESDPIARARLRALANGERTVPVLVERGCVVRVGWQGRGCIVDLETGE
ncbi:MAG: Uxx-star family glutaredoxin-like (seleno)protein [Vicinamibacterales bacterium]